METISPAVSGLRIIFAAAPDERVRLPADVASFVWSVSASGITTIPAPATTGFNVSVELVEVILPPFTATLSAVVIRPEEAIDQRSSIIETFAVAFPILVPAVPEVLMLTVPAASLRR